MFGKLLVGHVLADRYRIDALINEGGFGVVFRATDLEAEGGERPVAVKVLKVPARIDAAAHERYRKRFRHEAAYAQRLPAHPNVVPIHDFGSWESFDFLVMELLHGEDLRVRLQRPDPIPLATALRVVRDAARGVAVGHAGGVVHRDVKPGNIYLEEGEDGEPRVRILDFGIAKLVEEEGADTPTHVTLAGEGLFTEYYAAPEQLRKQPVTRAADVYSLGVVAFEVLTRTRLFTEEDQLRRKQGLAVEIPSVAARNGEVPAAVEEVVRRALADDPRDRFRDAAGFADALAPLCDRLALGLLDAAPVLVDSTDQPADATALVVDETSGPVIVAAEAEEGTVVFAEDGEARERRRWVGRVARRRVIPRRAWAATAAAVVVLAGGAVAMTFATGGSTPGLIARLGPDDAKEVNASGRRLFDRSAYDSALDRFARAMRMDPENPEYQNNYAYALLRLGRTDDAVRELEALATRFPRRSLVFWNLAEAYLVKADTTNAIITLHRLMNAEPPEARRAEAQRLLDRLTHVEPVTPEGGEWDVVPDRELYPYSGGGEDEDGGAEPDAAADTVVVWAPGG
jgi:tetratricopeptide (TPR) repeat protein/tRNA A-37 threonylcarbamoyl transferase component Bud32